MPRVSHCRPLSWWIQLTTIMMLALAACGPRPTPSPTQPPPPTAVDGGQPTPAVPTAVPDTEIPPEPTATPVPLPDLDADGAADGADLCPTNFDPAQSDLDADGAGDLCDFDIDGDAAANGADVCPFNASDQCTGETPTVVTVVNTKLIADPAASPIEAVQLVSFANADSALPDLLNVTVEPAGEAPLWTDAGGLSLAIYFTAVEGGPALPAAQAGVSIAGGRLSLDCPASHGGACTGALQFDFACDGAPCAEPPSCPAGHARCGWGTAAGSQQPALGVWGAYEPETNQVRAATGLPAPLPDALSMRYDVAALHGADGRTLFSSAPDPIALPYVLTEGTGDCAVFPACDPGTDIVAAALNPIVVDERPYLEVALTMSEPVAADALSAGLVMLVEESGGNLMFHGYLVDYSAGAMRPVQSNRKAWQGSTWRQNVGQVPADLTWTVSGVQANLRVPLQVPEGRVVWLISVGTVKTGGFNVDYFYDWTDPSQLPAPVAAMAWADGEPLPLVGFAQHRMLADPIHAYTFVSLEDAVAGQGGGVRLASLARAALGSPPLQTEPYDLNCDDVGGWSYFEPEFDRMRKMWNVPVRKEMPCRTVIVPSNGSNYRLYGFFIEGEAPPVGLPSLPPLVPWTPFPQVLVDVPPDLVLTLDSVGPISKKTVSTGPGKTRELNTVRIEATITNNSSVTANPFFLLDRRFPVAGYGDETGPLMVLEELYTSVQSTSVSVSPVRLGDTDDPLGGWALGGIPPGGTAKVVIETAVVGDRVLSLEVFDPDLFEEDYSNNERKVDITTPPVPAQTGEVPPVMLEVTFDTPQVVPTGLVGVELFTQTVRVRNTGQTPSLGTGMVFQTQPPADYHRFRWWFIISYQVGTGTTVINFLPNEFTAMLGDIAPGAEVEVEVVMEQLPGQQFKTTVLGTNSEGKHTIARAETTVPNRP